MMSQSSRSSETMRPAATPSLLLSCLCRGRLHLLFLLLLLIINSLLRLQWPGHLIVIVIVIVELVVVALSGMQHLLLDQVLLRSLCAACRQQRRILARIRRVPLHTHSQAAAHKGLPTH